MSNGWILSEDGIPPIPALPELQTNGSIDQRVDNRKTEENSYEISSNACSLYWNYWTKDLEEDFVMVSLYNNTESVIQMGPKCGLVALMMSQSLVLNKGLELNQNDWYELAKDMGFTKTGEMFSVENMAILANRVLSVETEIKVNLKDRINELVVHLTKGLPVLVPYDSDANHEPTLLGGQRAHWAIILGFCVAINKNDFKDDLCGFTDQHNPQLIHLTPKHSLPDFLMHVIQSNSYHKFLVYAKQGKSKHLHIWDFHKLCESNCNLVKTSRKLNESDIVLPENGGIVKGLNNQCLFISNVLSIN